MNLAHTISGAESSKGNGREKDAADHDKSRNVHTPQQILRSALDALSRGSFSEVLSYFDDRFKYNDHGLALEFTEQPRLTEFFEKSLELFPGTRLEIVSLFEDRDHAIAEWKLSATQTVPYGSISYRSRISFLGTTIVRVDKGRIVEWSDYYDQNSSRRISLAAFFTEWIEY